MRKFLSFALALFVFTVPADITIMADTESNIPAEPVFLAKRDQAAWVSSRSASIYKSPGSTRIGSIAFGDGLEVIGEKDAWLNVKDGSGRTAWIRKSHVSSLWILVEKKKRRLTFLETRSSLESWRVDLGGRPVGDKVMSGDNRTPEGEFYVCRKVPHSNYYKAFLISYPSTHHAERGLKEGLITQAQHAAIVRAIKGRRIPPQNTQLGNLIEIHGHGTYGLYDWTLGCVAVPDKAMDFMWDKVIVGTPILILP